MTTSRRSFGSSAPPQVERIPITFWFMRDEQPESYELNLLKKDIDLAAANRILSMLNGKNEDDGSALPMMIQFVSRYMDNKDGTPAEWKLTGLPNGMDEQGKAKPPEEFYGPDGARYPISEARRFEAVAAGSSRRRWLHLLRDDDTAEVQQQTMIDLINYIVELAGGRPTPASS